jgi:hypothetical protein
LGDVPLFALEIALDILPSGDSSARLETLLEPVVARASPRADLAPPHRPAGKATAV